MAMNLALRLLEHDGLAGLVVGPFALQEELGTGGFGVVYRGVHCDTDAKVAVKFLLPDRNGTLDVETRARFEREARLLAKLEHPSIVSLIDFGEAEGLPFIALEFVEGITLQRFLAQRAPVPSDEVARMLTQLLGALHHAHAQGTVHRDIKPSNIMLAQDERGGLRVKLMDFGVGKNLTPHSTTFHSNSRAILGTPQYMSPEQLRTDVELTHKSDLYSLGVVAHQALCGALPFQHITNPHQLYAALLDAREITLERDRIDGIDHDLADVIDKLTRKDPDARFADAGEALAWLRRVRSEAPT
ncbi:MAG: serine/threonine-protein kinase [Myxococcota bacterium]